MTLAPRVLSGRYRLLDEIGRGGMAIVYRGEDVELGRPVAIKILREQFSDDPEFLERFRREARAAAGLSHPNIIAVYDVGRDAETSFIVMELVEGEDLKDLIARIGPLPVPKLVSLGCQLAAALEYAHRAGIVHRDVKSQNVIVNHEGQVKIGDFGIAVALGSRSITQTGMVIGSVHYMSPEQVRGLPATPASDVYAMGVVLYEMATGRVPFQAESPIAVARMHLDDPPEPPQRWNPRLPDEIASVILTALRKDPGARFRSAAEVAAALRGRRARPTDRTVVLEKTGSGPTARTRRLAQEPTRPWTRVDRQDDPVAARRPRSAGRGIGGMFLLVAVAFAAVAGSIVWLAGQPETTPESRPTPAPVITRGPENKPASGATSAPRPTAAPSPTPVPATPPPPTPAPRPTPAPKPAVAPTRAMPRVEVPGVVGRSEAEARRVLQQAGLGVDVEEERSPNAPNDLVVAQNPRPGESVEPGRKVTITVGRPRNQPVPKSKASLVPNVEGMDEPEARRSLERAGFKVVVEEESAPDRKGQVIDQRPGAGDTVSPGTTVTITIGV